MAESHPSLVHVMWDVFAKLIHIVLPVFCSEKNCRSQFYKLLTLSIISSAKVKIHGCPSAKPLHFWNFELLQPQSGNCYPMENPMMNTTFYLFEDTKGVELGRTKVHLYMESQS